jgi:hypothetical protein
MNLSRWDAYSVFEREEMLTRMGSMVRTRQMPLPKYLALHPGARLTDEEIEHLYGWAHGERRRLQAAAGGEKKSPTD